MAGPTVHSVAQVGFGTGTNELYDRARPSYQSNALSHIRQVFGDRNALRIVEVGSGTGIFTRALLAHPEWEDSVAELRAIEPSAGMRDVFSKSVSDARVTVAGGTFDRTGVEDGWADMIVAAQAFHWCPDYNAASAEFARVLKPDGVVVLIWNMEDRDGAPWVAQLRDLYEAHEQGTPQFRLGLWRQTFGTLNFKRYFEDPQEKEWSYHLPGSLDIVVNRVFSKSYISVLPEDEKEKVKAEVRAIIAKGEGRVWDDEKAGVFQYPYKTLVVVAKRKQLLN